MAPMDFFLYQLVSLHRQNRLAMCWVGRRMRGRAVAKSCRRFVILKDSQSLFFSIIIIEELTSALYIVRSIYQS